MVTWRPRLSKSIGSLVGKPQSIRACRRAPSLRRRRPPRWRPRRRLFHRSRRSALPPRPACRTLSCDRRLRCASPSAGSEERSMYQDYRVIDADGHVLEPVDLWERYIDPEFRHQAPRGVGVLSVEVLGHVLPDVPGGLPLEAPDYTTGPAARYGFAARRNF